MRDVPPTPLATLRRAAGIGREAGLRYVYVGNAPELQMEDTRCAGCGLLLVERTGYRSRSVLGREGACPGCGQIVPGRWGTAPGGAEGA
jgi:pyruvate formate lyase activating enzyme